MNKIKTWVSLICLSVGVLSCTQAKKGEDKPIVRDYLNQIIDLSYTPNQESRCGGWFVDQGAWIGFTPPQQDLWLDGFCGPFSLDSRRWLAKSAVVVSPDNQEQEKLSFGEVNYYPGLLSMQSVGKGVQVDQRLVFADSNTVLLHLKIQADQAQSFKLSGQDWLVDSKFEKNGHTLLVTHPTGEITVLSFPSDLEIELTDQNYSVQLGSGDTFVAISTFVNEKEKLSGLQKAQAYLTNAAGVFANNNTRWDGYLSAILRDDMPQAYDRVAAKAMVTLMSNWKVSRGGLLHEGMVPSHAVGYFMGYWAWDTWKFAVPLTSLTPELSKNMIRSMFDYQLEDGMIIDCIYVDTAENNARDSKPPLAGWAIDAVFEATNDTTFLREMYPQLLAYHRWWYEQRDHNKNGICEFGSTDGTIVAAAWESGMDNAIRFDGAKMVQNGPNAWSFDQESVDLNFFLAYEYGLLEKFAQVLNLPFEEPNYTEHIQDYFFDQDTGFFYDKRIFTGEFVKDPGSEAYIPFWASLASKEQMDRAMTYFTDTTMFATYIPFPTIAANNPKYLPNGYWRGPIWLDQTYFGIKGLRNYGQDNLADEYTRQVFDRLDGLTGDKPIHENYDSHTGGCLKAPHFSWSASHLLLLYKEYRGS